jgi:hypothetical protein
MIDVEPLIVSGLDRLVPMPSGEGADWENVLRRAGTLERREPLTRRQRAVVLASLLIAIVVAVTTPVGAAIAHELGDFSGWLTGHPGKPASSSDQRAFEALNRRWSGFPTSTKLRELIRAEVGGNEYVLLGFRSGTTLCLQLEAPAFRHGEIQQCVPVSMLAHVSAPIVVVTPASGFGDLRGYMATQVSFGIVADGVSRVDVEATDGSHRAFIGGNAYLAVDEQPNTGNQVLRVSAVSRGKRTTVSIPQSLGPFRVPVSAPHATGPKRLQARIAHPHVAWLKRRTGAPHHIMLTREQRLALPIAAPADRYFVKPDPLSNIVVGFDGSCLYFVEGPERPAGLVSACSWTSLREPLRLMWRQDSVAGVAADGVVRVVLFLADGERETVPLRDNLFAALYPAAQTPVKAVGYDRERRVVAIESQRTLADIFAQHPLPKAARRLRPVLRIEAPRGATAVLHVGPRIEKYNCWRITFSTGQVPGACEGPWGGAPPKIWVSVVQPAGRDLFVAGEIDQRITARVELHFDNGDVIATHPVAWHYLFAIPKSHLSSERQFGYVLAIDHHGHHIQRQRIAFRTSD